MTIQREFDRREMIKKAAVAGGVLWATPMILEIPAGARTGLNSRPPGTTPPPGTVPPPPEVPPVGPKSHPLPKSKPPITQLPFTGDETEKVVVAGIAGVVTGAGLLALGRVVPEEA